MSTQRLFDVVFEGKVLPHIPMDKAIVALANISHMKTDEVTHLFNECPTVLKRGASKEEALQFRQVLRDAGLACHIVTASPLRDDKKSDQSLGPNVNSTSALPVSAGFGTENVTAIPHGDTSEPTAEDQEPYDFDFTQQGFFMSLATLSFLLPHNLELDSEPDRLPSATIGQRIWSAVSTFFHGIFLGYVLAFPLAFVVGLCLRFSDAEVTKNTVDAIRGGGVLLGMASAVFFMPILWRGHTFGQRALGILITPSTGEDSETMSGLALMIRRLTFRTRSASARPLSSRPWNSALVPFAATIILHFIMIPFAGLFLMLSESIDIDKSPRRDNFPSPSYKETTVNLTIKTQHTLRQLNQAMQLFILTSVGTPEPLTKTVFTQVLDQYMPPDSASDLLRKLDNGSLKLRGDLPEYQIGVYENNMWAVLNNRGDIRQEKNF